MSGHYDFDFDSDTARLWRGMRNALAFTAFVALLTWAAVSWGTTAVVDQCRIEIDTSRGTVRNHAKLMAAAVEALPETCSTCEECKKVDPGYPIIHCQECYDVPVELSDGTALLDGQGNPVLSRWCNDCMADWRLPHTCGPRE